MGSVYLNIGLLVVVVVLVLMYNTSPPPEYTYPDCDPDNGVYPIPASLVGKNKGQYVNGCQTATGPFYGGTTESPSSVDNKQNCKNTMCKTLIGKTKTCPTGMRGMNCGGAGAGTDLCPNSEGVAGCIPNSCFDTYCPPSGMPNVEHATIQCGPNGTMACTGTNTLVSTRTPNQYQCGTLNQTTHLYDGSYCDQSSNGDTIKSFCAGGYCNQSGLKNPACQGGYCNQENTVNPKCGSPGYCNQAGSKYPANCSNLTTCTY